MPRKRHIAPGFFTSSELYEAEASEGLPLRLAYAGLWCCADRAGRFEWKPRALKLDVLPYDLVDFEAVLSALRKHGFIRCYRANGRLYGDIPTFLSHQHPHPKEAPSVIPPYSDAGQEVVHACAMYDASMGHVPTYQPVGVSGLQAFKPSEVGASTTAAPDMNHASPPDQQPDTTRELLPTEYREDYDAMVRSSHGPDSFRREVAVLVGGRHPTVEGAKPEEVGRAIREMAMAGVPSGKLASWVAPLVKRRREAERDGRARAQVSANERRKREEQRPRERTGEPARLDLSATLSQLGIVPDKGAA